MAKKQLKQSPLILSSQFQKSHPRAGEPTFFHDKICIGLSLDLINHSTENFIAKLHTIRADFSGWVEKVAAVNRGEAVLRVVTWSGVPYRSPWLDVAILTKDSGVGVQKLEFENSLIDGVCAVCVDFLSVEK